MKDIARYSKPLVWAAGIAALLGLFGWFYAPALDIYFSQDDFPLLATSRPGWVNPWYFFTFGSEVGYRPLTQHFFFYFNQLLFNLNPQGHHASNLLIHLANSVLVGALAWRWIGSGAVIPAALIFAFHPVHFYETFWVSGVNQSGYVLMLLACMVAFSTALQRGSRRGLGLAFAAAVAAFLCKEDAVTLPAILTIAALLAPAGPGRRKRSLLWTLPFWALLPLYLYLRMVVLRFGFPSQGVYEFGVRARIILSKLALYADWLTVNRVFLASILVLLAASFFVPSTLGFSRRLCRALHSAALYSGLAIASVVPTLMVPSASEHYLSFAAAALGLWLADLLSRISVPGWRNAAAVMLGSVFLISCAGKQQSYLTERAGDLGVPLPLKAQLCRKWVMQLQQSKPPEADYGCALLFRNVPLLEWEKAWFPFVPMIAWDRPLPDVTAHIKGTPEPQLRKECIRIWDFVSGDAVRIQ